MIVSVDSSGSVSLIDPEVFTAFSVRTAADGVDAGTALAAAGVGAAIPGDDEVLVSIEWVRARVLAAGVPDGEQQLDGMLAYAKTKGWVDENSQSIRAHVES